MYFLTKKQTFSLLAGFFMSAFTATSFAQNLQLPIGSRSEMIIDRWTVKGYNNNIHAQIKPLQRKDLAELAYRLDTTTPLSNFQTADLKYARLETQEFSQTIADSLLLKNNKPKLAYFYKSPAELYKFESENFYLKINPVLGITFGRENNNIYNIFENHRGIEFRGGIDKKVYFYSRILESQISFQRFIKERIHRFQAVPGNGFYKDYSSKIFDVDGGFDYNNAIAYVGFNITRHIGAQFGYGSNFIGNGIRSLFLSDYANNYLYLKLNTHIGPFHYQNIFGELQAAGPRNDAGDVLIPKKYFAAHYLSYTINKNWKAGFFETVVFSRKDKFEFQYLNPVILYRTVEGALGSPDNVMVGFNFSGNMFKTLQVYGQLLLDEFLFKELILDRRGWWANKYGLQGGIKYFDALRIPNLDIQLEANLVMPYTYSHSDTLANYSHYNQPLAHPLGANFIEAIGKVSYRITPELTVECWIHQYRQGLNNSTQNWGENILESSASRVRDYSNKLLQGEISDVSRYTIRLDWECYHNMNLFTEFTSRNQKGVNAQNLKYFGAGFRINLGWKPLLL